MGQINGHSGMTINGKKVVKITTDGGKTITFGPAGPKTITLDTSNSTGDLLGKQISFQGPDAIHWMGSSQKINSHDGFKLSDYQISTDTGQYLTAQCNNVQTKGGRNGLSSSLQGVGIPNTNTPSRGNFDFAMKFSGGNWLDSVDWEIGFNVQLNDDTITLMFDDTWSDDGGSLRQFNLSFTFDKIVLEKK